MDNPKHNHGVYINVPYMLKVKLYTYFLNNEKRNNTALVCSKF